MFPHALLFARRTGSAMNGLEKLRGCNQLGSVPSTGCHGHALDGPPSRHLRPRRGGGRRTGLGPATRALIRPSCPRRGGVDVRWCAGLRGTASRPAVAATATADPPSSAYSPPTTGVLARLPASWIPYAELIRLDKPTGTYYLFFPCVFSTLMAASLTTPVTPPSTVMATTALFLAGALVMRGAGCTINDLWDRHLDPHVTRTRLRPLARKAITPQKALIFVGAQLLAGLAILLRFPISCLYYGIPSLGLVATYPLAKRVTYYPQFVLGLTFSWGAIMGFPALGLDLMANSAALTAAACLYASNVAWTVLYDMIYAHMDVKDDAAAGIKSMSLRYAPWTKSILSGLAVTQVTLLAASGVAAGATPVFHLLGCSSTAISLAVMIWKVQLDNVGNCWWWFRYGCWFTGGTITLALTLDYLLRLYHLP